MLILPSLLKRNFIELILAMLSSGICLGMFADGHIGPTWPFAISIIWACIFFGVTVLIQTGNDLIVFKLPIPYLTGYKRLRGLRASTVHVDRRIFQSSAVDNPSPIPLWSIRLANTFDQIHLVRFGMFGCLQRYLARKIADRFGMTVSERAHPPLRSRHHR